VYHAGVNPTRTVSLVIPCFNEAESLPHLFPKLDAAVADLEGRGVEVEAILVDDGSLDESRKLLREATATRRYLKTIHLARNFGQTAAMAAGFDAARFDVVVPLDADLQNDPADVAALLAKLDEGYDVVSGWRRHRNDVLVTRKLPSWMANALISAVSGVRLHDYGCTLKAYRRFVLHGVHLYGEMHRFIPIYAAQRGARVTEIAVKHNPRRHGKSKYGLGRVPNVLLDLTLAQMLLRFGTKPMHLFGKFGLLSILLSLLFFMTMVWFKLWGGKDFVSTPLPHLTVMSFLVGCLSILMGLLAEMTMRTYYEASQTATYVIREICSGGETVDLGDTPPPVTMR
jgi:glycosyltransferase involved in cell wall biosynthesis